MIAAAVRSRYQGLFEVLLMIMCAASTKSTTYSW